MATKAEQLKTLDAVESYLKERKDFAMSEDEHVTACRGLTALGDLRKHLNALPVAAN